MGSYIFPDDVSCCWLTVNRRGIDFGCPIQSQVVYLCKYMQLLLLPDSISVEWSEKNAMNVGIVLCGKFRRDKLSIVSLAKKDVVLNRFPQKDCFPFSLGHFF